MAELDELYTKNPGAAKVASTTPATTSNATASQGTASNATASQGTASTATGVLAQARDASSKGYDAATQDVDASSLASAQMNDITSQKSPLMQRARQEGLLLAARRGLQNSSLAAGSAQGAMVDRATPLASQNAAMLQEQALANQSATNKASEFGAAASNTAELNNSQLTTDVSKQNAALQTDVSKQNAALSTDTSNRNAELSTDVSKQNAAVQTDTSNRNAGLSTDVSKQNAAMGTDVSKFNADTAAKNASQDAAADNTMRAQVLQSNADLNKQYLAGTQAMDLATIQGRYQQLISTNEAASQLYSSYFNGISQVMANKDIPPDRVAAMVNVQQTMLEAGLRMMDQMNSLDLGAFELPGAAPGGVGGLQPTQGTGATSTTTNTTPTPSPTPGTRRIILPGGGVLDIPY